MYIITTNATNHRFIKEKVPLLFFTIIKVEMKNYKVNWVIIVFMAIKWVRLTFLKFLNVSLSWARQTIKWRNGLYIYKILMTLNEKWSKKKENTTTFDDFHPLCSLLANLLSGLITGISWMVCWPRFFEVFFYQTAIIKKIDFLLVKP